MKLLIVYSTKYGVSRSCAQMLADRLSAKMEVSVCDVNDAPPSPSGFDAAVVGGSIRMLRISKKLKAYLEQYQTELSNMPTALFLCCGFSENFDDYVELVFPKKLRASLGIHCFGGELKPDKLKGLDKFIVKRIRSSMQYRDFDDPDPNASPLPEILPETIYRLADAIKSLI